jgi:NAD(P)-dependent dehydrogenase (short-subunit alcohol dehydrogenase family)
MHFEAKRVIVVGGSAGMGREVAIDVLDHGGSAVIVGRSKPRVDDTVAELTSRGGEAWGIAADLTDRAAVADVQRALSEHHNDATLLVNPAGFFIPKAFLEYAQNVVEGMIARGEGLDRQQRQHVGTSSHWPDSIVWALDAKSRTACAHPHNLAMERAGHKIRVNAVAPAAVKTPRSSGGSRKTRSTLDTFAPPHPLGRVGTPADVANAVTFCYPNKQAGSPARFSTLMAASWPAVTSASRSWAAGTRNILAR